MSLLIVVKRPVKRRQRAPRPASPYSTDSNYSAILAAAPHKPYPKSERRRQLASGRQGRHHGRHGNGSNQGSIPMSPAMKPLPRELRCLALCLWYVQKFTAEVTRLQRILSPKCHFSVISLACLYHSAARIWQVLANWHFSGKLISLSDLLCLMFWVGIS